MTVNWKVEGFGVCCTVSDRAACCLAGHWQAASAWSHEVSASWSILFYRREDVEALARTRLEAMGPCSICYPSSWVRVSQLLMIVGGGRGCFVVVDSGSTVVSSS